MDPDPDFLPIRNRTQEKKSDPEPDKMTGSETLSKRNINLTGQCHEINQAFGVKNVKNVTTDNDAYTSETLSDCYCLYNIYSTVSSWMYLLINLKT